jgi:predicted LPLAT superfamily acyltransferase
VTPATAILLKTKVARGEVLVIVGDRIPVAGTERTVEMKFLGRPARFPQGPFILAGLLNCPIYTLFCVSNGLKYEIICEQLADRVEIPRANRESAIRSHVEVYVNRLEQQCRKTPLQWFNFYTFWG